MIDTGPSPGENQLPPPLISVVLSFYNEERVLPELLQRLRRVLRSEEANKAIRGYELIFVNDASTDGSLEVLTEEFHKERDLVIINMSRNFGVSECVLAGMRYAKGDAVIYMDADLQDPPEVIPQLIAEWRQGEGVEVVYTTRLSREGEPPLKMYFTKMGYRLINNIADIELPLDSGDFKLLSRRAVQELLKLEEKKPYLRGLVSWIGFKQSQVFYHRERRFDGREGAKHRVFSKRVINYWLDRALISFSDAPLKLSLFLGFFVSLGAFGYILVVIFQKIMGWHEPGWPAIMATMLFLGGVELLVLGFLGLYINAIYQEVKQRPNYIIKDVVAPDERSRLAPQ
ncbi:MAG: glycosyltransferase [Thermodesulfobacteriota bacterium]